MRRVESLNLWREWNGILNNLDEIHQKCRQSSSHLPISIPSELLAIAVCSFWRFWSSENCCKISLAAVILHSSSPPESADIFFNAPAHWCAVAKRKTHSLGKEIPRSTFFSRKTIHTKSYVFCNIGRSKRLETLLWHIICDTQPGGLRR